MFQRHIKTIQNQGEKQIQAIEEHGKQLAGSSVTLIFFFTNPLYFSYCVTFQAKDFTPSSGSSLKIDVHRCFQIYTDV